MRISILSISTRFHGERGAAFDKDNSIGIMTSRRRKEKPSTLCSVLTRGDLFKHFAAEEGLESGRVEARPMHGDSVLKHTKQNGQCHNSVQEGK
jgi:hypothetical protein